MSKRSIVALSATAIVGAALLAGCDLSLNTLEDGLSRTDPITEVHIIGGSGNVTIVGDSTSGVDVRRTARYGAVKPNESMTVSGTTLNLKTDCGSQCSASYEVRVGRGVRVTGENDSGNVSMQGVSDVDVRVNSGRITVGGATGAVTVQADSGNIEVSDVAGAVRVTVGSGNIEGRDLRGAQTTMEADSGNIDVSVPGTGDLTASAGSGNVTVRLPDQCCQIRTSVGSGRTDVEAQQDSRSDYLIDLKTDSGNIEVRAV